MKYSFFFLLFPLFLQAQRVLTHEDLVTWNRITDVALSNDGRYATWETKGEETDPTLHLHDLVRKRDHHFGRGRDGKLSADGKYFAYLLSAPRDTVLAKRRAGMEKDELPKDTLVIVELPGMQSTKIPNVLSFKMPQKWTGHLVYHRAPRSKEEMIPEDSGEPEQRIKKESKKNGSRLSVRNLATGTERTLGYATGYHLAKEAPQIVVETTGDDSLLLSGVYRLTGDEDFQPLLRSDGDFRRITIADDGSQIAFLADTDTTDARIRPWHLRHWKSGQDSARLLFDPTDPDLFLNERISGDGRLSFSEDGERLFFGTAPDPLLQDTSLLPEEIVDVEIWTGMDTRLYPQQNVQADQDKKRSYRAVYHFDVKRAVQLANERFPEVRLSDEGNGDLALGIAEEPYLRSRSWEGWPGRRDLYGLNVESGRWSMLAEGVAGTPRHSPEGKYVLYFSTVDTSWHSIETDNGRDHRLTQNNRTAFYDELNDRPMKPGSYGIASWGADDEFVLVYDRYDLWKLDPEGERRPERLTRGREAHRVYRYARTDREERFVEDDATLLLHLFDETSKGGGYATLELDDGNVTDLTFDPNYRFGRVPTKAKNTDRYLITKENFSTYPDLYATDGQMRNPQRISNAAPQQSEVAWGSVELYRWTGTEGEPMTGMLVKPANFDPTKQYPMIVNFYERSSQNLHRYPRPFPHRSTINYAYYASNGYLIFNPDVPYRVGYPGESAYNAVMSGVTNLIDEGFVDRERIGLQGHSWGGYQVAHIVTKTDLFACAESGAPVVNMTSAYGGIRWGSGLSRMFQYEQTQSRIGGTLWETPLRYLENSPLFFTDKINTPLLILHNDEDGAVPWYQGIEWFTALRRLGKPVWMLNYRGEPHWPVKPQNRQDFQRRMSQFFAHYLKGEPMPEWMERGIPATERGINLGYER